jgi:hypothetical protein
VLCGTKEGIEQHHVLPRSEGGTDEPTNILTVCGTHHGLVHNIRRAPNISKLTKAGLAAAKARGQVLGNPKLTPGNRQSAAVASAVNVARAAARAADLRDVIADARSHGKTTLRQIADHLTSLGIPTARGSTWTATAVSRVLTKLDA